MKKLILATLLAVAFASSAFAGQYKSAGCGLGSMIIKDDGFIQIFAVTTNASTYTQLFGITSGTSNCGGSYGLASNDAQKEMYVSSNHDALSQEMAQGSGEHLATLASLMGCQKNSREAFGAAMKKNFRAVGSQATTDGMINAVQSTISADPALNKSCAS